MIQTKVTFPHNLSRDFQDELKQRVKQYFADNKIEPYANAAMVLKTVILLSGYVLTYVLVLSEIFPLWMDWILCAVLGILTAGIGFSVAHDAIHGAYSRNKKVNYGLGLTMNLIGGNAYVWSITHNVVHHTYTNIAGHDEDLDVAPFIRLTRNMPHRPIHRIQHIVAFFAYGFATFFWVFWKDYKKLSQASIGPYKKKAHPAGEIVTLVLSKLFYYGYTIVLPLLVMNDVTWWQFLIGYVTVHFTSGIILGVIFQLAHVVEHTEHPMYDENGKMQDGWAAHQLRTTSNFATNNRWLNWYVGGLNFQVEHHLFSHVCSIHYKALSPIVKELAEKHNLPYNVHPTFGGAIASHYRTLKAFGRPDSPHQALPEIAG